MYKPNKPIIFSPHDGFIRLITSIKKYFFVIKKGDNSDIISFGTYLTEVYFLIIFLVSTFSSDDN
ncbi:hypothetical protein DB895_10450 [Flavobacterium psychrotolerans]|uniref:Uncharacterized protein n=1 Tax=Flavobacterium psychrotolerans TaxID=2169410 RepID=A0A2U1JI05_9FLAO|nr:hypothetical protein DB895_10450 [Flavobacterium psychrotolerans]